MDPLEYLVPNRKRLPYGMMNFADIRHEDYYYVDKTRFIPLIEQADRFFFFIRPRRFGKSLTLNMLQHYYDVNTRDKQKGEFFVHGFTLAMTAQNRFYRPISEQDTQAGYVDIFLCPMLEIYSDMTHSYIVELKYAKYKDPDTRVEELRQEAIAQASRYADTDTVKRAVGNTQLHKIVVVYKGMEMRVCEMEPFTQG